MHLAPRAPTQRCPLVSHRPGSPGARGGGQGGGAGALVLVGGGVQAALARPALATCTNGVRKRAGSGVPAAGSRGTGGGSGKGGANPTVRSPERGGAGSEGSGGSSPGQIPALWGHHRAPPRDPWLQPQPGTSAQAQPGSSQCCWTGNQRRDGERGREGDWGSAGAVVALL